MDSNPMEFNMQYLHFGNFPGLLCLSVYSTVGILYYDYWDWPRLFFYLLRGFSEWLFIIGVYGVTRQLVTRPPPGLARLSELAMPFYLTHQQILVPIAAACSWLPHLSKETRHLSSPIPL